MGNKGLNIAKRDSLDSAKSKNHPSHNNVLYVKLQLAKDNLEHNLRLEISNDVIELQYYLNSGMRVKNIVQKVNRLCHIEQPNRY